MTIPYGIYIHAPWCAHRCPYCAFNVYVDNDPPFHHWLEGVQRDWEIQSGHFSDEAATLYFGGGTPSLVPPSVLKTIVDRLPLQDNAEITLEANPENIDSKSLSQWLSLGVNRLSVGVQTFDSLQAKRLTRGKVHGRLNAILSEVASAGFRSWSFDLMFALPNQSLSDLNRELDRLLQIAPPHISLYGLTYEPGTPFERRRKNGTMVPISDEAWAEQFELIHERLIEAGYVQYEISNFAKVGHRSKHNEAIWRNGFYAGLGPGSHGFLPSGQRTVFASTWEEWLGERPMEVESISSQVSAQDALLTWIRHIDGIIFDELNALGWRICHRRLAHLVDQKLIWSTAEACGLTPIGRRLADHVTVELIDSLKAAPQHSL